MASIVLPDSTVFLQPGELFATQSPVSVKTILGSCLAVTMRAPRLGLAAMAHCLLPNAGELSSVLSDAEALRYVDSTIELMLRRFAAEGAERGELEIKLFGGSGKLELTTYSVGQRNVATARKVLARYGIKVAASATGGRCGMAIQFDTGSGNVLVKRLPCNPECEK
jgi:chemotaxis protein CheD